MEVDAAVPRPRPSLGRAAGSWQVEHEGGEHEMAIGTLRPPSKERTDEARADCGSVLAHLIELGVRSLLEFLCALVSVCITKGGRKDATPLGRTGMLRCLRNPPHTATTRQQTEHPWLYHQPSSNQAGTALGELAIGVVVERPARWLDSGRTEASSQQASKDTRAH